MTSAADFTIRGGKIRKDICEYAKGKSWEGDDMQEEEIYSQ
jgi:hypothetical protein